VSVIESLSDDAKLESIGNCSAEVNLVARLLLRAIERATLGRFGNRAFVGR
jgi:hypothetical protein